MNVLAIDTATAICRMGLVINGVQYCSEAAQTRDHARLVLPMMEELFARADSGVADLNVLAWNAGPGSFTGLRIAASAVQALAYANDLPVLSLSSLMLLAYAAQLAEGERAVCVLDARMDSVYLCDYQMHSGQLQALGEEQLLSLADAKQWLSERRYERVIGADAELLGVAGEAVVVSPAVLLELAQLSDSSSWVSAAECAPRYLRDATQWQKRKRIRAE